MCHHRRHLPPVSLSPSFPSLPSWRRTLGCWILFLSSSSSSSWSSSSSSSSSTAAAPSDPTRIGFVPAQQDRRRSSHSNNSNNSNSNNNSYQHHHNNSQERLQTILIRNLGSRRSSPTRTTETRRRRTYRHQQQIQDSRTTTTTSAADSISITWQTSSSPLSTFMSIVELEQQQQQQSPMQQQQQQQQRQLEDYYAAADDAYSQKQQQKNQQKNSNQQEEPNEQCSQFLVSFLEGTSNAKDTCEGIMNAYTAAECATNDDAYSREYDFDDYFEEFYEHTCCQSLMSHHKDYCEEDQLLSSMHLLVAATVLLLCEVAKTLVKRLEIHFLPDAATCILVGTLCGFVAHIIPGVYIDGIVFDENLFMSVLLPPIIFEAALSVSKIEFKRRRGSILIFATFGTVISTFTTGLMVHYVSSWTHDMTFPVLDSLVFGALISSIDPVAILSVLTSLNLNETDTVFILVFGESLLNDGIAITVFQTLVDRFDGKTNVGTTSLDEVLDALANFLITMFGSIFVGIVCGYLALGYFTMLEKKLSPVMEVGSFFLWALIPFYISEGIAWSGIVAIVVMGFIMDIYIAAPKAKKGMTPRSPAPSMIPMQYHHHQQHQHHQQYRMNFDQEISNYITMKEEHSYESEQSIQPLENIERIRLSAKADKHVRFVAHLTAQLAENAIFAYVGLFLLSSNYDWDMVLVSIAIMSCVLSRALMVITVSQIIWYIYKWRGAAPDDDQTQTESFDSPQSLPKSRISRTARAIIDKRTQLVLVLAGLRGAVSLALVENVPIYNAVTGEGCEFKPLMKAMTSGSIIFTTFVFGGGAYYILPHLGLSHGDRFESSPAHFHHGGGDSGAGTTTSAGRGVELVVDHHDGMRSSSLGCSSPRGKMIQVPQIT